MELYQLQQQTQAVVFKNCAPFTSCISKINITQKHNNKEIDVVMSTDNLIEHNDNYSKMCGGLCQYYYR